MYMSSSNTALHPMFATQEVKAETARGPPENGDDRDRMESRFARVSRVNTPVLPTFITSTPSDITFEGKRWAFG